MLFDALGVRLYRVRDLFHCCLTLLEGDAGGFVPLSFCSCFSFSLSFFFFLFWVFRVPLFSCDDDVRMYLSLLSCTWRSRIYCKV